jgi:magnesium chelatase family protein
VELSKQGGRFDLPIALALLSASGQLAAVPRRTYECYGELGLAGELKPVGGFFLAALQARGAARHALIVPAQNGGEVRLSAAAVRCIPQVAARSRPYSGPGRRRGRESGRRAIAG